MNGSERILEQAEAMVALECDAGIARIREQLASEGEDICVGCDDPIDPARRAALPSAERCISCQEHHERTLRGSRGS